jgi:hypothetical protein
MLRHTTTYNVWNIDEEEYRKSQMPYLENQDYQILRDYSQKHSKNR